LSFAGERFKPGMTLQILKEREIVINHEHHISQARITARELAKEAGLDKVRIGEVVTSVSELAGNIFFHSTGGMIILKIISDKGNTALEVIAEDRGPGIPDVELAMQDGFTTNGGLGSGLPGVRRLMDEFGIHSKAGAGTRIVTRKWRK